MLEVRVLPDGSLALSWWTPEGADLFCFLCGRCEGWRRRVEDLDYNLKSPPCPIASLYCG